MRRLLFALVAVVAVGSVIFASGGGVSKTSAASGLSGNWGVDFLNLIGPGVNGTCTWTIVGTATPNVFELTAPSRCDFSNISTLTFIVDETTGALTASGISESFCTTSLSGTATVHDNFNRMDGGRYRCEPGVGGVVATGDWSADRAGFTDNCPGEDSTGLDADADGCIDDIDNLSAFIQGLCFAEVISATACASLLPLTASAINTADRGQICAAINELQALKEDIGAGTVFRGIPEDIANLLVAYITNVQNELGLSACLAPGFEPPGPPPGRGLP